MPRCFLQVYDNRYKVKCDGQDVIYTYRIANVLQLLEADEFQAWCIC